MEGLLHHNGITLEQVSIIGYIAMTIDRIVKTSRGVKYGERAVGRLSRTGRVFGPYGVCTLGHENVAIYPDQTIPEHIASLR